jgi:hypothetical protein
LFFKTAILQVIVLPVVHKWNIGGRAFQNWFMDNLTWGSVRAVKRIVDIMYNSAKEIYEGRKKALETGTALDGSGKDILTILSTPSQSMHSNPNIPNELLVRSNMESSEEDRLPDHEILAQIAYVVWLQPSPCTPAYRNH